MALGHENLRVYQASIQFCARAGDFLAGVPKGLAVHSQLDRASTSICLNIAEGAGKFTSKDQAKFYDIARGSALESGACLDVAVARRFVAADRISEGKALLESIVGMLVALVRAGATGRSV